MAWVRNYTPQKFALISYPTLSHLIAVKRKKRPKKPENGFRPLPRSHTDHENWVFTWVFTVNTPMVRLSGAPFTNMDYL